MQKKLKKMPKDAVFVVGIPLSDNVHSEKRIYAVIDKLPNIARERYTNGGWDNSMWNFRFYKKIPKWFKVEVAWQKLIGHKPAWTKSTWRHRIYTLKGGAK